MGDLFGIASLISNVGVDGVKIKQEPGLPEKSSNEILTELFSTFDVDGNSSPLRRSNDNDEDDDDDDEEGEDDGDKSKKKKKKSKKKHKHKDKKHKKRSRRNSSDESDAECDGSKRKKKKKLKRRRGSSSSESLNSNDPHVKIKKEEEVTSSESVRKSKNCDEKEMKTVFDLVQSVMIKKESQEGDDNVDKKFMKENSPELSLTLKKKNQDDSEELIAPRLLEKNDQPMKGKILIKDLKNSSVYNEAVKEVENKKKEKAARMEDGEISDSNSDNRTPTLSPSPPLDSFDLSDDLINVKSNPRDRQDLRLVLKEKEKNKKAEIKDSRLKTEERSMKDNVYSKSSRSSRDRSIHSRDIKKESDSFDRSRRNRGSDNKRTSSNDKRYNRDRSNERKPFRSRDRSRYFNDQRCRSEDRYRSRARSRSRGRTRTRGRNRSRSRSRSRSYERKERIEIDKKKLLEIARKNAINMIKKGALPLAQQDKAIAAIQAGGKTVEELIDFCKSLSKSEALGELSSVSSEEGDSGSEKGFHHPFLLKERPNSIVMNIRDSKPIPTKTFQERTTESSNQLRLQFPVSSGQQHRKSENEWIDVVPVPPPKKIEPKKPFVQSATPLQPQAFTIKPPLNATAQATASTSNLTTPVPVASPVPVPVPAPMAQPQILSVPMIPIIEPLIPDQSQSGMNLLDSSNSNTPAADTVFPPPPAEAVDVGIIVSQRLAAMRKLRENPNDVEALNEMYHAQNEMKTWAESKQMPGQFTGSTGAKVLSPAELTSGYQAWARKDQLTSAQPVSGGMGMALLQKMGWRPGEGLGKNKEGTLEPLQLEVKLDKRGLVSEQDVGIKMGKVAGKPIVPTIKTLEGKHPVSLLGEFCSKKKYGAPVYELCFECGPDHKKNFLFKVKVNGIEYKPSVASPNKKQAKAEAAQICLQTLGLLPS